MPTIRHEFDERFRSVDWLRRNDRRRRMQRGARSGGPLGIFMIETVPMIMVRAGGGSNGGVRKARRSNAPQKMPRAATHMIAARYEKKPRLLFRISRTSDMCTPTTIKMIVPRF